MTGYCERCGKLEYTNASEAQRNIGCTKGRSKSAFKGNLRAYRCPSGSGWHVGHAIASKVAKRLDARGAR